MSTSSSPLKGQVSFDRSNKRKDRLLVLDIPDSKPIQDDIPPHDSPALVHPQPHSSENELKQDIFPVDSGDRRQNQQIAHPPQNIESAVEPDSAVTRSTSASSSLDPYYFGARSPFDSPVPPLPDTCSLSPNLDMRTPRDPVTPIKDPASIDRRGLIGVGELATPRWSSAPRYAEDDVVLSLGHNEGIFDTGEDVLIPENETEIPDSPWTIEAVDGEEDVKEDVKPESPVDPPQNFRAIRTRPSIAEESGGEEILYPRKLDVAKQPNSANPINSVDPARRISSSGQPQAKVPLNPLRKAKKRTSEEYERDQSGESLSTRVSLSIASKEKGKEERASTRKHRSLGVSIPSSPSIRDKGKERRRESMVLTATGTSKSGSSGKPDRHIRQASASSSSTNHADGAHSRRVHTTDFSHLPPSPSTTSIQQILRHTSSLQTPPLRAISREPSAQTSPNVAHSLLRGTQEGWSGMDDEATAEALRKLDGLSGKTARARASIGSLNRSGSLSRPGTPPTKAGPAWEGGDSARVFCRDSARSRESLNTKDKDHDQRPSLGSESISELALQDGDVVGPAKSGYDDTQMIFAGAEKTPKKSGSASARSSFTPKRGSASSTTYASTPTTTSSSRDSGSLSMTTNATSVSTNSGRYSASKLKRNSGSSDISSTHSSDATLLKDRVAALAVSGDVQDDDHVPPVPPLPKDLSNYRSPPQSTTAFAFPPLDDVRKSQDIDIDPNFEISPVARSSPAAPSSSGSEQRPNLYHAQEIDSTSPITKAPLKKWSFSNALNLIAHSPSTASSGQRSFALPSSPRSGATTNRLRKSTSKEQALPPNARMPVSARRPLSTGLPDAMTSASSLVSVSSADSAGDKKGQAPPPALSTPRTPDRHVVSRSETNSSGSTNLTASASTSLPAPLSPAVSLRRGPSAKRLTPSSIPFFRRSSSQSMQFPLAPNLAPPASPTPSSGQSSSLPPPGSSKASISSPRMMTLSSPARVSTQKKSSVLSLTLPSLLKGTGSRRSLHADDLKESKEAQRAKEKIEREKEKSDREKEKQKKEDKERSESRISMLIGRKRGKTLSSTEAQKPKAQAALPPIQMSALPTTTAQRVASLKASSSTSASSASLTSSASSASGGSTASGFRSSNSSRLTAQTVSSMHKQSDASLRSSRGQLPTIAGSPSISVNGFKERRESPSSLVNSLSGSAKDTPTKIPRISSRTSTTSSPPPKGSTTLSATKRGSMNVSHLGTGSARVSPVSGDAFTNEFGILENGASPPKSTIAQRASVRGSPTPSTSTSRFLRQSSAIAPVPTTSVLPRKSNRDSISFTGIRKLSTGSVASVSSVPGETHHRFSALSPSKGLGLKLLSPKVSIPVTRTSGHQSTLSHTSRQSPSSPSPISTVVDEDELIGDEEMLQYIRRQQTKKLASGATQAELDELLRFPEPLPPTQPTTAAAILKGPQAVHLSPYERKEILDYVSVHCIGARSKKKLATPDDDTHNYGYDDDRGDYLVVNHDHLAYRYEIIDTLGKGSFGQVLHCRDHRTGESVAIKIIRNKKRFHHQALVEIKILENLRKWDQDEKHHVIKMTEYFYFRNHLCIAMELLSINLYELIKANGFVGFTTALIRRFTSQMLMSLSLMRHHRIVHCDLKPENVLLRHPAKSAIKVIDFGSSCFEHEKVYTYIQSRFYRSPEVILGMSYHMAIDMWSLGCILAELFTGFPIFPGENEQEQLSCIMEVLGVPERDFINRSSRRKLFFDPNGMPRAFTNSKGRRRRPGTKTLSQVLKCNDEDFIDFISKCLVWDPERRIKPQAALRHPFILSGKAKAQNFNPPPTTSRPSSNSSASRSKTITETPKKSQIGAPTPLAARSARVANTTANSLASSTSSLHSTTLGSSRSYRSSQVGLGSMAYSSNSRTLSGFATTSAK